MANRGQMSHHFAVTPRKNTEDNRSGSRIDSILRNRGYCVPGEVNIEHRSSSPQVNLSNQMATIICVC
jgi:hypothetical protein